MNISSLLEDARKSLASHLVSLRKWTSREFDEFRDATSLEGPLLQKSELLDKTRKRMEAEKKRVMALCDANKIPSKFRTNDPKWEAWIKDRSGPSVARDYREACQQVAVLESAKEDLKRREASGLRHLFSDLYKVADATNRILDVLLQFSVRGVDTAAAHSLVLQIRHHVDDLIVLIDLLGKELSAPGAPASWDALRKTLRAASDLESRVSSEVQALPALLKDETEPLQTVLHGFTILLSDDAKKEFDSHPDLLIKFKKKMHDVVNFGHQLLSKTGGMNNWRRLTSDVLRGEIPGVFRIFYFLRGSKLIIYEITDHGPAYRSVYDDIVEGCHSLPSVHPFALFLLSEAA